MAKSVVSIAAGSMASKAVGLAREILFAAWFGAGETAAAYRVAQTAFLFPTHALVGDSLGAGLLPLYRSMQADGKGHHHALTLAATIYALIFSLLSMILLYAFAHMVTQVIAPGASANALQLATVLLRIMSLALPFYIIGYLLSYVEAAHGAFGAIAWRPLAFNLGAILGAALAVLTHKDHWLATGLVIGHVIFFAWTVHKLRGLDGGFPKERQSTALLILVSKRFARNTLPLLALPMLAQGNILTERIVSSWLGTAVIPSVDYARFVSETIIQLVAFPLGILTMASYGGKTVAESIKHVCQVSSAIIIMCAPVAVFLSQNATQVVTLIFARGQFGPEAIELTSEILRWFAASLAISVTAYYFIKAMNAQLRNRESLLITLCAVTVNVAINVTLWRHVGVHAIGLGAVAYSVVLFSLCVARLGIWRQIAPLLGWVTLCSAAQALVTWKLVSALTEYQGLAASACAAAAIWLVAMRKIPALREAAAPALTKIPILNKLISTRQ